MSETIRAVETFDVRFPTSRLLDGSDAMNPDPDYSLAYVVLRTDGGESGHGFAFTIGRGTQAQVAAIDALAPLVVGRPVAEVCDDLGELARRLADDSQLRWLGPDKGIEQMAIGAIVNAAWDLAARRAGKPLWKYLADLSPEQVVAAVDFRYLADAICPDEALDLLRRVAAGKADRAAHLAAVGYPAYTTSAGWLGYSDDKLVRLARQAVDDGFAQVKLKVGANLADDVRRCGLARQAIGPDVRLAVDANQRWDVPTAIDAARALADFDLAWVEEPTHPDDVLGYRAIAAAIAPVPVAGGEHVPNRIVFKQLLRSGALGICQIDACRVSGVNENLAILLLAAKYGVPVCPHAGGVGLCEVVQHLAMFDYVAVGGTLDGRMAEYVDHLHEQFAVPARVERGRYVPPTAPGSGAELLPTALTTYGFPFGPAWAAAPPGAVSA